MPTSPSTRLWWIAAFVVVVLVVVWLVYRPTAGTVYSQDTSLSTALSLAEAKKITMKNGATLTLEQGGTVTGTIACDGGPLRIVSKGSLTIQGRLNCNRADGRAADDIGNGILIVAEQLTVAKDAVIASNGHVQVVKDSAKLAVSQEAIDKLYAEAAEPTGKPRLGPMTPIEQVPEDTPGRPTSALPRSLAAAATGSSSWSFVPVARAQEPAADIGGQPVADTIKVGGTWLVGTPGTPPPPNLTIPTPPKDVTKIIVLFDFGDDGVTFQDFTLTGPDGRKGQDDVNQSCDAKGGQGENAMRLNVRADNITINNFDLYLGSGGEGGTAETTQDCDRATATGGQGGEAGNFKMVAAEGFQITGAFNLYPGKSGAGGKAIAHSKKGDDNCDGKKGGDATATGGKGGDNTKVLVASGVSGTENITVNEIVGGRGGDAEANGGNGGNGNASDCNGGDGGKATATGGKGGDTTSNRFTSRGGDGGNATAKPGTGGNGGQGSPTENGGDGGKGGDASATGGAAGSGKTANGADGRVLNMTGGNGGNGGDGCQPGAKGAGGAGEPNGLSGADGKNLCPGAQTNTSVTLPANTNTATAPTFTVSASATSFKFSHQIGKTACPTPIGTLRLTSPNAPPGSRYQVDPKDQAPGWLNHTLAGDVGDEGINLSFTCELDVYETQTLAHDLVIEVYGPDGTLVQKLTIPIGGEIKK